MGTHQGYWPSAPFLLLIRKPFSIPIIAVLEPLPGRRLSPYRLPGVTPFPISRGLYRATQNSLTFLWAWHMIFSKFFPKSLYFHKPNIITVCTALYSSFQYFIFLVGCGCPCFSNTLWGRAVSFRLSLWRAHSGKSSQRSRNHARQPISHTHVRQTDPPPIFVLYSYSQTFSASAPLYWLILGAKILYYYGADMHVSALWYCYLTNTSFSEANKRRSYS